MALINLTDFSLCALAKGAIFGSERSKGDQNVCKIDGAPFDLKGLSGYISFEAAKGLLTLL